MSKFLRFDYVVVGGGSADTVLAARLSEDASKSVLLLEALRRRCLDHARCAVGGDQSNRHLDGRDRRRTCQGSSGEQRVRPCQIRGHQRAVAVFPVGHDEAVQSAIRPAPRERDTGAIQQSRIGERSEEYGK
jgi:hypothetical protein